MYNTEFCRNAVLSVEVYPAFQQILQLPSMEWISVGERWGSHYKVGDLIGGMVIIFLPNHYVHSTFFIVHFPNHMVARTFFLTSFHEPPGHSPLDKHPISLLGQSHHSPPSQLPQPGLCPEDGKCNVWQNGTHSTLGVAHPKSWSFTLNFNGKNLKTRIWNKYTFRKRQTATSVNLLLPSISEKSRRNTRSDQNYPGQNFLWKNY
jgi:hypothetical protein